VQDNNGVPVPTDGCTVCQGNVADSDISCWPPGSGLGSGAKRELHTEILFLQLRGPTLQFPFAEVAYLAGQPAFDAIQAVGGSSTIYENSFGEVESLDPSGNPDNDFPASSFWAVRGVVEIDPPPPNTCGLFYARDPILMYASPVDTLPPENGFYEAVLGGVVEGGGGAPCGDLPVDLYDVVSDSLVGEINPNVEHFVMEPAGAPDDETSIPSQVILTAPTPNPSGVGMYYRIGLPQEFRVRIRVMDVNGRVVAFPIDTVFSAGIHTLTWEPVGRDGRELPSGVYYLRMDAGGIQNTQRFVIAR
jgi:hypothetical protein